MKKDFPFVYGAQYYRAPTPDPSCWEKDFIKMKELGFNTVKFWVQWRWSERSPGVYYWKDLDQLMELAGRFGLKVILNLICDVMPVWAPDDCRMIDRDDRPVQTEAVSCRQLGGYPGPCYNHPGMLKTRQDFFRAALKHFNSFPALLSWDVWNEPEHHLGRRSAIEADNLLCYCSHCAGKFHEWLANHYQSIDALNRRWGRCYSSFTQVELPRNTQAIIDFIDWREFQLEVLTAEADWRLAMVREEAPHTFPHLHVVPNTIHCFNSTNCVDDFALAEECEIFGCTTMADPLFAAAAASAAGQRLLYNAEWHINFGSIATHPRIIDRETFLFEAISQLAWNVRGILYWQFRPETLGSEAPAWGLIHPDGTDRPVTRWAKEFAEVLEPHYVELLRSRNAPPGCAILKSTRNELFFNAFPQNKGNLLYRSLRGYVDRLIEQNTPFRFLSSNQLEMNQLEGVKLLILPAAYLLSQAEADAADRFCREGGTLIAEGTVGGYDYDSGRHSARIPGCGLAERWGIHESEATSSYHLDCSTDSDGSPAVSGDVAKAFSSVKTRGGEFLPLDTGWGALQFGHLECEEGTVLASYRKAPCVIRKTYGTGTLVYSSTYLGIAAAEQSPDFLSTLLPTSPYPKGVRITSFGPFHVAENRSDQPHTVTLPQECRDLFSPRRGKTFRLAPRSCTLLKN